MSDTRQRILEQARALFNAEGLHGVGVREVARAAGIAPGNLGYHFPTKDDLVAALVLELHQRIEQEVFVALPPSMSLLQLYRSAASSMRGILDYRFLPLSAGEAARASPRLRRLRAALRERRRERHDLLLRALAKGGHLELRRVLPRSGWLFEQGELISSGWVAAAALQGRTDDAAVILHYAKVGVALLDPWCTPKGTRELHRILSGACDSRDR